MKQLENYLSQITEHAIGNVVIFAEIEESLEISALLKKYVQVENLYYALSDEKKLTNIINMLYSYKVSICSVSELNNMNIKLDMVIFGHNKANKIDSLSRYPIKYMIGRLDCEEDYFAFWEKHREDVHYMYIEQAKSNDAGYEIFEWQKGKSDIELSVIVPVYNVAVYLPQCIESLIQWKAPYVEYLFIDDGSTDESSILICKYLEKDKRVRLIQKENGGCASARNRGIKEARGRYIGFVDADDFIEDSMFYELLKRAFLGNYDYTYCGFQKYYEDTGKKEPIVNDCLDNGYVFGEYDSDKVKLLAVKTRVAIWRGLYKKSILEEHQIKFYEELRRFDDLPFRVEYTFVCQSAACVPKYLYNYRIGREGQDIACTDERLFVHFRIFNYLDMFVENFKDQRLWDILQAVKVQTHEFALSKIQKRYCREYAKQARRQLKEHAGYVRSVIICLIYAGRENIAWLTKLWFGLL